LLDTAPTTGERKRRRVLPYYRLYQIGLDGHISIPPEVLECSDEQEAISKAAQLADGKAAELWAGERLVVRFPRDKR
jgi:hypothetical protein